VYTLAAMSSSKMSITTWQQLLLMALVNWLVAAAATMMTAEQKETDSADTVQVLLALSALLALADWVPMLWTSSTGSKVVMFAMESIIMGRGDKTASTVTCSKIGLPCNSAWW